MPKDRLLSTLALVRAGVEYSSKIWAIEIDDDASVALSPQERTVELAQKLMDDVYSLSTMLNKGDQPLPPTQVTKPFCSPFVVVLLRLRFCRSGVPDFLDDPRQ